MMKYDARLALGLTCLMVLSGTYQAAAFEIIGTKKTKIEAQEIATFDEPWAMTLLPNGGMLVTEKSGTLKWLKSDGAAPPVAGVPSVAYGGQGGLGDVIVAPDFATSSAIYLSYAEAGKGLFRGNGTGAVVVRARLDLSGAPKLADITRIWAQDKTRGQGHYSHKLAIGPDNKLYITSGDRQQKTPAQNMSVNLGKVIRLNLDGSVPADNPFQNDGEVAKTFWTIGHRNVLGIAFDGQGKLWTHEMGPRHGDELNLIEAGSNYGWPIVSNGDNYSGIPIPDHDTRPEFNAPEAYWVPSIAPSSLVIYDGDMFTNWQGDALISGLVSEALIHVSINGAAASETERFEWGSRVREVEQAADGAVYVLEDDSGGRLLKLQPV